MITNTRMSHSEREQLTQPLAKILFTIFLCVFFSLALSKIFIRTSTTLVVQTEGLVSLVILIEALYL